MLNCYKPLAAPDQDDGKGKRRERDGKVSNGQSAMDIEASARRARGDGRTPYDMRQVRVTQVHALGCQAGIVVGLLPMDARSAVAHHRD